MYETFNTDALVIGESGTGEVDSVVTLLSRTRGVITAFANGARKPKNRLHGATSLFCYSDFTIFEKGETLNISGAALNTMFFKVRDSIEKLAAAEAFCELARVLAPHNDQGAAKYLRVILNSLHYLCEDKISPVALKCLVELRYLTYAGFMPRLVACEECGRFESEYMYFSPHDGLIYCEDHPVKGEKVPLAVIDAMRHIVFSEIKPLFSLKVPEENLKQLSTLLDVYLKTVTGMRFPAVDFLATFT